ncbi:uncharacterized protein LOC134405027 [Elgaria multicarinata webbii]|uniref:uncharacterized protein LOC134405027 n=1 Tax=Elgaria multicarinata webbii TaxID=159646 RepID=UPI002FCD37A2
MLYCWGDGSDGQLGLGEEGVSEPVFFRQGPQTLRQEVMQAACGERHTLLLHADGSVVSCGDNGQGQLGRRLPSGRRRCYVPEQIQALETQTVVHVSCGKEHSLAVCNSGNVFSWGAGAFGQLGTGAFKENFIPKKIVYLSKIIQIACGHYHSVALAEDGRVFSWGQNTHGQLGLGKGDSSKAQPQHVAALDGIPLAQVAAGGAHSFALSLSGVVYGWGRNQARQLGLSQTDPKEQIFKPRSVGALKNLDVTYISCGDEHTAVLTQNGSIFTFGDNTAGQLGHSTSIQKAGPQKVDWIDGPVSHLACGSYHTLVYISASGQLISFGRGPLQHDRNGTSDSKQDETPRINISALVSPSDLFGIQIKQIFAGTYVNFARTFQTSANASKSSHMEALPKISRMDRSLIETWISTGTEDRHKARREIEAIFSSPPCLTASFLRSGSPLEGSCCIAVDLQKAREAFVELAKRNWISEMIISCLVNHLIPALPLDSPHQEAFSAFLLLPQCLEAFSSFPSGNLHYMGVPFAKAVVRLSKRSSGILEKYWSLLPDSFLDRIVQMLKKVVLSQVANYYFYPQCLELIPPLQVLKRLYKVNKMANCKLPLSNFYIDEIGQRIDTLADLTNWHVWIERGEEERSMSFCRFPFVFNLLTKIQVFYLKPYVTQEMIKLDANLKRLNNILSRNSDLPKLPVFILKVRRQNLVEDTLRKLSRVEDICLKMQLLIKFEVEMPGAEGAGILLEFFSYVFEEMVRPEYKMFVYCEDNSPMWFPSRPSVEKNKYFLFGVLCGLCMANRVTAYIPFPLAAFKKLLNKKPSLDDLKELNPVIGKSLQAVLDYEYDDIEENLQQCYSIFWDDMEVELILNGRSITVNNKNKKDFVNRYVDYVFNKSVDEVFKEFRRGFYKVLDEPVVGFFEPQELMEAAIGNANYDWDLYEKNTKYGEMYSATHHSIKMFWKVFHELTLADKKGFLLFVTGSDRVPAMGMDALKLVIHSHTLLTEDHIPEAQICYHILFLPPYSTIEKLKEKLLQAIENNQGFGKWIALCAPEMSLLQHCDARINRFRLSDATRLLVGFAATRFNPAAPPPLETATAFASLMKGQLPTYKMPRRVLRSKRGAQMPRSKGVAQMPRSKGGAQVDLQPDSPPSSTSHSRASLQLFPQGGYHPGFSREDPRGIRQISCKNGCLAIVKTDRTVVVFGRTEEKNGGCQSPTRRPKHIRLKKKARVDLLDCEESHLLILSSEGKLSEHSIASGGVKSEPRLLKELGDRRIIQIACGDHHSLALSKGGELFAWGQNEHGQLGVGTDFNSVKEPQLVCELVGLPLAKIAAGSSHSLALSVFGDVYSWGKNDFGQLGLGDTEGRYIPTCVKALEHKMTAFISCGGEHTAVLSKDGLVCTFGAGSHGQLGHNATRNELYPRLVAELFGARVSQVACGRWHTLVYVPDLGEVYSFGRGAEGQLGQEDNCDRQIPLPLGLTVNGKQFNRGSASEEEVKIIAGENQSIVLLLKEKNSYANLNRTLARVEEEKVSKWLSNVDSKCWQNMEQDVNLIFSSVACINGSFLEKSSEKHFRTSWTVADVDMSAVFLFCEKITAKPKLFTVVINALKKLLQSLPSFSDSFASPERLRVFLIIPILVQRQDIKSDYLLSQLAEAICCLPQKGKQILGSLWSNLEVAFFKDLVGLYQWLVSVKVSSIVKHLRSLEELDHFTYPLQVLQMLYEVNCKIGCRIQESNFYVHELKKMLSPPSLNHTQNEEQLRRRILSKTYEVMLPLELLTQFPCIFEMEAKVLAFQCECTMWHLLNDVEIFDMISLLHVNREHLIQNAWQYLRRADAEQFQKFLKVHFVGEAGVDDGGLSQEFFEILRRELCAPKTRIFRHFEDSQLIWFSRQVPAEEDIYFLIGNLFGMALFNSKIAAFPFPLALFKMMANIQPTLEDLKELSPAEGSNLQALLDEHSDDIIESAMLNFTVIEGHEGSIVEIELKENGAKIPVTKYNRKEYVDAYVNYLFNDSVKKQFGDFMHGFERGCPTERWKCFLPSELRLVLSGHAKYNWEQLEKNAKYVHYKKSDETIEHFWAVFHDLPEENKKDFLAFLTGTDHIPAQGMETVTFTIQDLRKEDPDLWCPEASTCFRILRLPRYTDRDVLEKMLLRALEFNEKFGLS